MKMKPLPIVALGILLGAVLENLRRIQETGPSNWPTNAPLVFPCTHFTSPVHDTHTGDV